jgi:hypothetical protein
VRFNERLDALAIGVGELLEYGFGISKPVHMNALSNMEERKQEKSEVPAPFRARPIIGGGRAASGRSAELRHAPRAALYGSGVGLKLRACWSEFLRWLPRCVCPSIGFGWW